MAKTQSDLIEWYKLETEFFQDHVRHTKYLREAKNRNVKVKENWTNCGYLGRGGFGVVYKQIEKDTGRYRAIKIIDKRLLPRSDYSGELLVMAILAKVGVPIPEAFRLSILPYGTSCRGLMLSRLASVTIRGVPGMVRGARDTVYCNGVS